MDRAASERARIIPLPRCPFCHEDVARGAVQLKVCPRCHAFHHEECWGEAQGCSSCPPLVRIALPAEPVRDAAPAPAASAPGVAATVASAPAATPARATASRRRRLGLAALGGVALVALVGAVLDTLVTAPHPAHDPESVVREYFSTYVQTRARFERSSPTLDALATPLSGELAIMEGGRFDEPLADSPAASEVTRRWLTDEPTSARVLAGARSFRLVADGRGGWLLDRTLSDARTTALGVRLRLPLGLEPTNDKHAWRQGDLSATVARLELGAPLATAALAPALGSSDQAMTERTIGVLQLEAGEGPRGSAVRRDDLPPRRLGATTRVFAGEDARGCAAVAYVEVAPGTAVALELRGPRGHESAVVELLRASLGTIEFFPDAAPAVAAWVPCRLDGRAKIAVPPSFGRTGERAELLRVAADEVRKVPQPRERQFQRIRSAPGTVLSTREIYLAPVLDEGRAVSATWVLVASGVVDGKGVVLTLTAPAGRPASSVALEQLERIADTFEERAPEERDPTSK